MPIDINIIPVIDKILIGRAQNSDRDYSHFHPSEWEGCHRKKAYAYYHHLGAFKIDTSALKFDPVLLRCFDNGHKLHDRYKEYLMATGALKGKWMCLNFMAHQVMPKVYGGEEKLGVFRPEKCECGSTRFDYVELGLSDGETWWAGHVDAIIDLAKWPGAINNMSDPPKTLSEEESHVLINIEPFEERELIIDFKSMSPYLFKDLKAPKPEHITQMQIYLYLAGLRYGKFIYENKGNQRAKEFLIVRDDEYLKVKKAEAIELKFQLSNRNSHGVRVLPDRGHASRTHQECKDCKFRGHCWK